MTGVAPAPRTVVGGDSGRPGVPITAVKLLVAGGFGVGKTTMVSSISEITPLRTEEVLTEKFTTSAERRLAATSNEERVRVLGS